MKKSKVWLELAMQDLRMAQLAMGEKIYNQVCFHSQQAAEKAVKGFIVANGRIPPKTHKIIDLVSFSELKFPGKLRDELILMDRFYIPTRYPDALPGSLPEGLPKEKEAKEALEIADKAVGLIKTIIGENQ